MSVRAIVLALCSATVVATDIAEAFPKKVSFLDAKLKHATTRKGKLTAVTDLLNGMLTGNHDSIKKTTEEYDAFMCKLFRKKETTENELEELKLELKEQESKLEEARSIARKAAFKRKRSQDEKKNLEEQNESNKAERDEQNKTYKKNTSAWKATLSSTEDAIGVLEELANKEDRSSESFVQMETAIKKLNLPASDQKVLLQAKSVGSLGAVVGVLEQMRTRHKADIASAENREKVRQEAYDKITSANDEAISELGNAITALEETISNAKADVKTAMEKRDKARKGIEEAEQTLQDLEDTKKARDHDYHLVMVVVADENVALAKALNAVSNDNVNRADKRRGLLFIQSGSIITEDNPFREIIVEIGRVKQAIEDEEAVDQALLSECTEDGGQMHQLTTAKEDAENAKQDASDERTSAVNNITENDVSITESQETIGSLQKEMDDAIDTRKEEQDEYMQKKLNNHVVIGALRDAIGIMRDMFDKANTAKGAGKPKNSALDEDWESAEDALKKRRGDKGNKIIEALDDLVADAQKEQEDNDTANNDALSEYNALMETKTGEVKTQRRNIATTKADKADNIDTKATSDKVMEEQSKIFGTQKTMISNMKPKCDFIEKNYDDRKAKREAEIASNESVIEAIKGTPAYQSYENAKAKDKAKEAQYFGGEFLF